MTTRTVILPGPVAVIPSPRAASQLENMSAEFVAELTHLSTRGELPVRLDPDTSRLIVYARRCVAFLYLTSDGDAYRLGNVAPRTFRDEQCLLTRALLVRCPAGWHLFRDFHDITRQTDERPPHDDDGPAAEHSTEHRMSTHWPVLARAWALLDEEADEDTDAPGLPGRDAYLDLLTEAVRAAREIQGLCPDVPSRPTDRRPEPRRPGRETPHHDGHRDPHRARLDAIDTARGGVMANHALVDSLATGECRPYRPDPTRHPHRALDPHQSDVFARALAVPDLLLVLGPPGTGKSTTIAEIARACAERGERVLIVTHSDRAIDDALAGLPPEVKAVCVNGHAVRAQADVLRRDVLRGTAPTAARLAEFDQQWVVLDRWLGDLERRLADAYAAEADGRQARNAIVEAAHVASSPLRTRIDAANATVAGCRASVTGIEQNLAVARGRLDDARARTATGALRLLYRRLVRRRQRRVTALETALSHARAALDAAHARHAELRNEAKALAAADPTVVTLTADRRTARAARESALADAASAADAIREALRAIVAVPERDPTSLATWTQFLTWAQGAVATVRNRSGLLAAWRERVGDPATDISGQLVRYADVVAATCLAAATNPLLDGVEFDLAIVDEAGRISTADLLVPLVRSGRAVIFGDHQQPAPYPDAHLRRWAECVTGRDDLAPSEAKEIVDFLRESAFTRLYRLVGPENRLVLPTQRRMPEVLARFVSRLFYDNALLTAAPAGDGGDGVESPAFRCAFALVDTADRAPADRHERPVSDRPGWPTDGYVNDVEADVITSLVCQIAHRHRGWAVLVPYDAQAEEITTRLAARIGDAAVTGNVGTIDSVRGDPRDLVIYGFTRSNTDGDIGTLADVRGINAAITRTARQLVLVGDTTTLRAAREPAFARLVRELTEYLVRSGDVRRSGEMAAPAVRAGAGGPERTRPPG